MIIDLWKKLIPVYSNDKAEYDEILEELKIENYKVNWYASSGLDFSTYIKIMKHLFNRSAAYNSVLVMSDYDFIHINKLKQIYRQLDNGSVSVDRGRINIVIDQMIPLKLWNNDDIERFKRGFKEKYNFSEFGHRELVCDNKWHIVYLNLNISHDFGNRIDIPVVFVPAENLLVFKEIFEKYNIPIELFFAIRVAGKSNSWDGIHDFNRGNFPQYVQSCNKSIRPRYWGLERNIWGNNICNTFKKQIKIPNIGFGEFTIYKTNWR